MKLIQVCTKITKVDFGPNPLKAFQKKPMNYVQNIFTNITLCKSDYFLPYKELSSNLSDSLPFVNKLQIAREIILHPEQEEDQVCPPIRKHSCYTYVILNEIHLIKNSFL